MRPSRALPGVPALAPGMDLLVARENTEGFYNALMEASRTLERIVEMLLASPETRTADLGGPLGTRAFADRVVADLLA